MNGKPTLVANEDAQRRQQEQLQETEQAVAEKRQGLAQEREQFLQEQQQARQEQEQTQTLFVEMRLQAESYVEQLPEIELRAGTTLDRLVHAREQLRDHLSEISAYVRQCQEDTERDSHKIQEKERVLRQHQDEHRLALVSFRQRLIDWQAQVAESKRTAGDAAPDRAETPADPSRPVEAAAQRGSPEAAQPDQRDRGAAAGTPAGAGCRPEPDAVLIRNARPDLSAVADVFKTSVVSTSLPRQGRCRCRAVNTKHERRTVIC